MGKGEPKLHHGVMFGDLEAISHPTLHHTSILNVYEVFEPLYMLWMGIWLYPYTLTPVQVGQDIAKIGGKGEPNNIMVSCSTL